MSDARRAGVRLRLEFLLAFYFEKRADLGENVRGRAGVHALNIGGQQTALNYAPSSIPAWKGRVFTISSICF